MMGLVVNQTLASWVCWWHCLGMHAQGHVLARVSLGVSSGHHHQGLGFRVEAQGIGSGMMGLVMNQTLASWVCWWHCLGMNAQGHVLARVSLGVSSRHHHQGLGFRVEAQG